MITQRLTGKVLQDPAEAFGEQQVMVEGLLVVEVDRARIEIQKSHVEIDDATFLDRLLDAVPRYLGGDYLYRDPVRLIGVLKVSDQGVAISGVESCALHRDGEEFVIS